MLAMFAAVYAAWGVRGVTPGEVDEMEVWQCASGLGVGEPEPEPPAAPNGRHPTGRVGRFQLGQEVYDPARDVAPPPGGQGDAQLEADRAEWRRRRMADVVAAGAQVEGTRPFGPGLVG